MKRSIALLAPWLPPIAWMAIILVATSLPSETQGAALQSGGPLSDPPRALLHVVFYAVLSLAFALALRNSGSALLRRAALPGAFLLATAYGAGDEYHQTFLANHGGWPEDIGWDALGAFLALVSASLVGLSWGRPIGGHPSSA